MTGRLTDRVALVTGAGNGVGKAIALALAAEGAQVVVNDLGTSPTGTGMSSEAADTTVAEIVAAGGRAVANYDSVADAAGCGRAVATADQAFGPVDLLIANAGAVLAGGIDATDDQLRKAFDLVVFQKFWLSRLVVPRMVERGFGRIVATASEGARGKVGKAHLRRDHGGNGVDDEGPGHRSHRHRRDRECAGPGRRHPHLSERPARPGGQYRDGKLSEEMWQRARKGPGPVEHVPPVVTWLCTSAAAAVTGRVFHAGGGRISVWSDYEDLNPITKGDPDENPPYTLDELDELMPGTVLQP